jgi:hypothetical protein
MPPGAEGVKLLATAAHNAFPDLSITIDHLIAEGDLVVLHITTSSTMKGDFAGMPANGKHATWESVHIDRMVDEQDRRALDRPRSARDASAARLRAALLKPDPDAERGFEQGISVREDGWAQVYAVNPWQLRATAIATPPREPSRTRAMPKVIAALVRTDRHNHREVAGDAELAQALKVDV